MLQCTCGWGKQSNLNAERQTVKACNKKIAFFGHQVPIDAYIYVGHWGGTHIIIIQTTAVDPSIIQVDHSSYKAVWADSSAFWADSFTYLAPICSPLFLMMLTKLFIMPSAMPLHQFMTFKSPIQVYLFKYMYTSMSFGEVPNYSSCDCICGHFQRPTGKKEELVCPYWYFI